MSKSEDTEITLGTGKMLGLFFGLVILCAVFFGMEVLARIAAVAEHLEQHASGGK
jgi:hypothetical protein